VPAFEAGAHYEIPDDQLSKWIKTNPANHADLTTAKNKALGGRWVPLVKTLKSWNRASGRPIEPSFLVEIMALELVDGPFSAYPDEARRFFAAAGASIDDTWGDPAGLGPPVSDEMTPSLRETARPVPLSMAPPGHGKADECGRRPVAEGNRHRRLSRRRLRAHTPPLVTVQTAAERRSCSVSATSQNQPILAGHSNDRFGSILAVGGLPGSGHWREGVRAGYDRGPWVHRALRPQISPTQTA
jgi:hypothetical protein